MACRFFSLFLLVMCILCPLTTPTCTTTPQPKIKQEDISPTVIIVNFACPCPPRSSTAQCDTTVRAVGRFNVSGTAQQVLSDVMNVTELNSFVAGASLVPFQLYDIVLEWVYPNGTILKSEIITRRTDSNFDVHLPPPEAITVTPNNTDVIVSWRPPNPIFRNLTGYRIFVYRSRFEVAQVSPGALFTSVTFSRLLEGQIYVITMAALQVDRNGIQEIGTLSQSFQVRIAGMLQGPPVYVLYFIHREQNFEYYFTVGVSSVDPGRVYDPKLVPHFGSAVGLAIDTHNSRLFAGFEPGDIFQFSVETVLPVFHLSNGTEFKTMLTGLGEMATDWINRKLVWIQQSDSGQEYEIVSMDYDEDLSLCTLSSSLTMPVDITVDPVRGYLYWSTGIDGHIYRADLLTGNNQLLIYQGMIVTSLSISRDYLYFLNSTTVVQTLLSDHSQTEPVTGSSVVDFQVGAGFLYEFRNSSKEESGFLVISLKDEEKSIVRDVPGQSIDVGLVALYGDGVQPLPELRFAPGEFNVLFGSTNASVSFERPVYHDSLAGQDGWMPSHYILKWYTGSDSQISSVILNSVETTVQGLRPDTLYHFTLQVYIPSVGKVVGPIARFSGRTVVEDVLSYVIGFSGTQWVFSTLDGSYQPVFNSTQQTVSDVAVYVKESSVFLFPIWGNTIGYVQTNISVHGVSGLSDTNVLLNKPSSPAMSNIEVDWHFERLFYSADQQIRFIEIGDFVETLNKGRVQSSDSLFRDVESRIDALTVGPLTGRVCWAADDVIGCIELNGLNGLVQLSQRFIPNPVTVHGLAFSDQSVEYSGLLYELIQRGHMITVIGYNVTANTFGSPTVIHNETDSSSSITVAYLQNKLLWLSDPSYPKQLKIAELSSSRNTTSVSNLPLPISVKAITVSFDQQTIRASLPCRDLQAVSPGLATSISRTETSLFSGVYLLEWDPNPSRISCGDPPRYRLDIVITSFDGRSTETTVISQPSYSLNTTSFHPYTNIVVKLQAFTLWARSSVTSVEFFTRPTKPGPPGSIRLFYMCNSTGCDATLRWDPPLPSERNGKIINYRVRGIAGSYLQINETLEPASSTVNSYEFKPVLNLPYTLEVAAVVEDAGEGESIYVNQTFTSGNSNPIPILTIVNTSSRFDVDVDTRTQLTTSGFTVKNGLITRIVHDNSLCWVSSSNVLQCLINGKEVTVQQTAGLQYHGLAYDWISRKLYVSTEEQSKDSQELGVFRIQKCDIIEDGCTIVKMWDTSTGNGATNITTLLVDAIHGSFWVAVFRSGFYKLERYDIEVSNNNNRQVRSNSDCLDDVLESNIVALDVQKQRILVQARKNGIYSCSHSVCGCWLVVNATQLVKSVNVSKMGDIGLPASSLTVDSQFIYWIGSQNIVYYVSKENPTQLLSINMTGVSGLQGIVAGDISQQPLPGNLSCLAPSPVVPAVVNVTGMSVSLSWSAAGLVAGCQRIVFDLAQVTYTVRYWVEPELEDTAKVDETFDNTIKVEGLKSITRYNFRVKTENFWNFGRGTFSDIVSNMTGEGKSSPPRNVTAQLTQIPIRIEVMWSPPEERNGYIQSYKIFVHDQQTGRERSEVAESLTGDTNVAVEPSKTYRIQVVAVNSFGVGERSDPVNITIYDEPPPPIVTVLTHSSIQLTVNEMLLSVKQWSDYKPFYRCKEILGCVNQTCSTSSNNWQLVSSDTYPSVVSNLSPATKYEFTMGLTTESYFSSRMAEGQTKGSQPAAPTNINVDPKDTSATLRWGVSCDNGAGVIEFCFRLSSSDSSSSFCSTSSDFFVEDPTDTANQYAYLLTTLTPGIEYSVQIAANNSFGLGEWSSGTQINTTPSAVSTNTTPSAVSSSSSNDTVIIIAAAVASLVVLIVVILVIFVFFKRQQMDSKPVSNIHYQTEDTELEMLRSVRRRTNQDVPFNFNPMYTADRSLVDGLPVFPRSQLTLNDFLGQGQFGEVYMGMAHGILAEEEATKVAVKTLRKDANEGERVEFLTEARFMSNFQHPNILRLLGVCLDNNPQYMIMELMEGGDLLTFIREARRGEIGPSALTLSELIKISFDICAGGKYLEQRRFVHRDLACRNCLVSSKGFDRVVKIGDFGLARNIYENHYYRKEGEGLLPVRWMAPESLVDGLFTTQSDVWSYGVVLWEIFTLGHQPYPTQTNQEVLKFIVQGGRLERPDHCPEDIYGIMLMCWAHQPHGRPTFRALLERLKVLRNRVDRQSFVSDQQDVESQPGSDSELEEQELTMELDEAEREESALAATGEGQVHLGMADATERYVSQITMSRQNSSRHGRIRQSLALTMSEALNGGASGDQPHYAVPRQTSGDSDKGQSSSPFTGNKRKGSTNRRKSSGGSSGPNKSHSSSSIKRLSKRLSRASAVSEEPDRVEIPSAGIVIEFGSASRLI